MNFTQNDRLKQVTSDTLIVGVDVGSQTHFLQSMDDPVRHERLAAIGKNGAQIRLHKKG